MNKAIEKAIGEFGSQRALSEAIGTHQTLVSHYLTGRRLPSYKVAKRLQEAVKGKVPWYAFMETEQEESESDESHAKEDRSIRAGDVAPVATNDGREVTRKSAERGKAHCGAAPVAD